jgi:hypothetical protein
MPGVIDGRKWLQHRRQVLRDALEAEGITADQRAVIEAELAQLDQEVAASRRRWWWRWLGGGFSGRP